EVAELVRLGDERGELSRQVLGPEDVGHRGVADDPSPLLHRKHRSDFDGAPELLGERFDDRWPLRTRSELRDAIEQYATIIDGRLAMPGVLQVPARAVV